MSISEIEEKFKDNSNVSIIFEDFLNVDENLLEEYFYTALWSSSAANEDVRIIARKLLFDIVRIKESYISNLISLATKLLLSLLYLPTKLIHLPTFILSFKNALLNIVTFIILPPVLNLNDNRLRFLFI